MRFLVNDALVETEAGGLRSALDFIRGDLGLTGTKEGCREGDCGACAVLVGERSLVAERSLMAERSRGGFSYRAIPSCLLVLDEIEGRHLVTIEGLARGDAPARGDPAARLSPVMRAIAEANGSQCGFCSPGFVISLSAYLLNGGRLSIEGACAAVEGNLCRCTGYGAIKRAAARLVDEFARLPEEPLERLEALAAAGVLPSSCAAFAKGGFPELGDAADHRAPEGPRATAQASRGAPLALGGGSDYLVRNPEPDAAAIGTFRLLDREPELKRITRDGAVLSVGAAVSWREFFSSPEVLDLVPGIGAFEGILASPLVRERATLGGNIVNASPVGDLTSMLIALGAVLRIEGAAGTRELPIEKLFLGYKKLDLALGEIVAAVLIPASRPLPLFSFEKASKREKLDIAAVNTAALFELEGEAAEGPALGRRIARARLSAGGASPVPLLLAKASAYLAGKPVCAETALEASRIASSEVTPIGDVRGSADYRRRVLGRLVLAHFIRLFPGSGIEEAVS